MHNEKLFIKKSDSVEVSQRKTFSNQINDQTENLDWKYFLAECEHREIIFLIKGV